MPRNVELFTHLNNEIWLGITCERLQKNRLTFSVPPKCDRCSWYPHVISYSTWFEAHLKHMKKTPLLHNADAMMLMMPLVSCACTNRWKLVCAKEMRLSTTHREMWCICIWSTCSVNLLAVGFIQSLQSGKARSVAAQVQTIQKMLGPLLRSVTVLLWMETLKSSMRVLVEQKEQE